VGLCMLDRALRFVHKAGESPSSRRRCESQGGVSVWNLKSGATEAES
jgi:hypothetical protein